MPLEKRSHKARRLGQVVRKSSEDSIAKDTQGRKGVEQEKVIHCVQHSREFKEKDDGE